MVGERLEYEIDARDNTEGAASSVGGRFGSLFSNLAVQAAAVGLALLAGIEDAANRAQATLRTLRVSTGNRSPEQEELLAQLLASGFSESDAIAAIGAIAGPGQNLGLDPGDVGVARTLGGLSAAGGDPTQALQALSGFGDQGGPEEIRGTLNLAFGQALGRGVDAGTLSAGLRSYGPVLNALGLNTLEAAAFIVDLASEGISVSRVSPALNRFIRDASAAGIAPRTAATQAFEDIRQASDTEAGALGQEYFGAEGGLRLTQAIRSGRVGFGEQLRPDDLEGILTLASLAQPTYREAFERRTQAAELGGLGDQAAGLVAGFGTSLPLLGPVVGSLGGRILGRGDLPTLAEDPISAATAAVQNERLDTLIELQRQQLNELRTRSGDGVGAWSEAQATSEGGLQ